MDAIILAGGLGTRLQMIVKQVPKPLALINGRPFLDIILSQIEAFQCVQRVVLAVGYKAAMIQARYKAGEFRFAVDFSVETSAMGTGGAFIKALPMTTSRDVLVMNGDSYVEFDLRELEKTHEYYGACATMVVVEAEDTARFGAVKLSASGMKVVGFVEKSAGGGRGFINAGCYLFSRRVFEGRKVVPASLERDILPGLQDSIYAQVVSGKFIDIGTPESYSRAAEYLR